MTIAHLSQKPRVPPGISGGGLVHRLGEALAAHEIAYCQWKGNHKRDRWLSGVGDIDLLVDRAAAPQFVHVLGSLGFKRVDTPPGLGLPGVESYLGFDPGVPNLIHVHVHYRLVIGRPWTISYALPIEHAVLDSAVPRFVFRAPGAEFDLILLVLRLTLRVKVRELLRRRPPLWLLAAQMELDAVELEADRTRVVETLKQHLPCVDLDLFDLCRRALHPAASAWSRYRAARALRERLSPFARRPRLAAVVVAFGDRARALIDHRPPEGKRLAGGGVVALLGGDGAGKTTCARELRKWLATELATLHAHLGRPPRASLTYLVGVCLKLSAKLDRLRRRKPTTQSAGLTDYLFLFRHLCTARDRYRLYRRAHRFAAAGGVVIAERYPVPINHFLAGPSAAQGLGTRVDDRWTRLLRKIETRYYDLMLPPDTSIVLKLQPDSAVRRKPEEPPEYVRTRARVVWETDWDQVGARVIDVERPLPEVLSDLKSLIWAQL